MGTSAALAESTRSSTRSDRPTLEVPSTGYAKLISAPDAHQEVRPDGLEHDQWNYNLWGAFGSGCFNPHYSPRGAYVLANSGGHTNPTFFGAVLFDFTTASWDYLPCLNAGLMADTGKSVPGINRATDPKSCWTSTADPLWEMNCVTDGEVPSPPHPYRTQVVLAPDHGGGAKGSMLYVTRYACDAKGAASSKSVHAFDLVAQKWSRKSTGEGLYRVTEGDVVFDPLDVRYYTLPHSLHYTDSLRWFDPLTGLTGQGPKYPRPNDSGYANLMGFIHEGDGVRALIACRRDPATPTGAQSLHLLAGIDMANQSAGWIRRLSLVGEPMQSWNANWIYHPIQNVYYRRNRSSEGQRLWRLIPPNGNPLTGTWRHDSVTLQGDMIPELAGTRPNTSFCGYRSLMYIAEIQMLGWVAPTGVCLLNP